MKFLEKKKSVLRISKMMHYSKRIQNANVLGW
jgi:hypothetical protein